MKWTHENRCYLYKHLVREYGPYSGWENVATPKKGKGEDKKYKKWLEDMATALKNRFQIEVSSGAIQMQIAWAIPTSKGEKERGHFLVYIHNTYCALQEDFISSGDLPDKVNFIRQTETQTKENPAKQEEQEETSVHSVPITETIETIE